MSLDNVVELRPNIDVSRTDGQQIEPDTYYRHGSGNGGGDDMQSRVAKLESDVSYIQRDIGEIKTDVKSIDGRLTSIETGISSLKTTLKATGAIITIVFAFCTYLFGTYATKIFDAINGLVLK